ncbi:MAG: enoyl-CoA hydratase/isomerase family protein [Planctomycetota bacterium]
MPDPATLDINGPVATLTLRRTEQRNALSTELLDALHARIDDLAGLDRQPHAIVVTGEGRAFCAGMDLKQVIVEGETTPDTPKRLLSELGRLLIRLRELPGVTIASVNGAAIGGGCGLAAACDLAVTHADAKLGYPEVDLGLCPAVVAPWLVRKIGHGRARRVLLSGGIMTGQDAHALGIVDHLVPRRDDLPHETRRIADRIATGSDAALAATKQLLNDLDGSLDADIAARGAELSASVLLTPDAQQRLRQRVQDR